MTLQFGHSKLIFFFLLTILCKKHLFLHTHVKLLVPSIHVDERLLFILVQQKIKALFSGSKTGINKDDSKMQSPKFFVITMRITKRIALCLLNSTGITLTLRGILASTMESRKSTYSPQISGFQIFCCTTSKLVFALLLKRETIKVVLQYFWPKQC